MNTTIDTRNHGCVKLIRTNELVNYYNSVSKYAPVDRYEEEELFRQYHGDDKKKSERARNKIVCSNQRFVVAVAKKFANESNAMDLVIEGNVGLLRALDRFDPNLHNKFISYAVHYIRREMLNYLMKAKFIRMQNGPKVGSLVENIKREFYQKNERFATTEEIIDILYTKYNIDDTNVEPAKISSIDETFVDEDGKEAERESEYNKYSYSLNEFGESINKQYDSHLVEVLFNKIDDERTKKILSLKFGIGYSREYTLNEISEIVGLTKERVRQITFYALKRMRHILSEH
jgi:RNA polymerase sigma factor (sigma-70 family)